MLNGRIPGCLDAGGFQLDVRRMNLPADCFQQYARQVNDAVDEMRRLEAGEKVNSSEDRQVGHYWLRKPEGSPYQDEIVNCNEAICEFSRDLGDSYSDVLWIGIGGSALGPQLLHDVLRDRHTKRRIHFFDNTDPSGFARVVQDIGDRLQQTLVVVVSKSGGTQETRNGMLRAVDALQGPEAFGKQAVAITQTGSALDRIAAGREPLSADFPPSPWLASLPMWDWVGGRTSLFSAVGLLPAHLLGFDVDEFVAGAAEMDSYTSPERRDTNPALLMALCWFHAVEQRGLANLVVLPYCDQLGLLSKYLQQLIMESLGKEGKGISVFGNKGTTDQHSFVQQLRDGRADFFANFVCVDKTESDLVVQTDRGVAITAGDYLAAFQNGTAAALSEAGRLSMRLRIGRLDARSFGGIVALFERAVGYFAAMIGINAYDQPGVEAGKRAAVVAIALHAQLIEYLRDQTQPLSVSELASATDADPVLVLELLDRLARLSREDVSRHDPPEASDWRQIAFSVG